MWEASISTSVLLHKRQEHVPLAHGLETIAEAGFACIEFSRHHSGIGPMARHVEACGLSVWSVHGNFDYWISRFDEAARAEARRRELARMDEAAVYAPCPYVIHWLDRFEDPRVGRMWRQDVEVLLERSRQYGFCLAVETPPAHNCPHYRDSAEMAAFVRSFDDEALGVTVDLNHANLAEDLVQVAQNFTGLIANVHISDNHGQREEHLLPGQGEIDLLGGLRAIARAGYTGAMNLECRGPQGPTVEMLTELRLWAETTARAVQAEDADKPM